MATIYNSDVTNGLAKTAKIQQTKDSVPNQLAEKIVPVLSADPHKVCNVVANKGTTGTIYTTPTTGDFYLYGASVSTSSKDANTTGTSYITITMPDGTSPVFIAATYSSEAATSTNNSNAISLTVPVLVKKGTNITFTAGSTVSSGVIYGIYQEN